MRMLLALVFILAATTTQARTWQPTGPYGAPSKFLKIPDPAGNRVYAISSYGMHRSDDHGESWQRLSLPRNVRVFPESSQWAVTPADPNVIVVVVDYHYAYRSTDAGTSWTLIRALEPEHGTTARISAVAISPQTADDLSLSIGHYQRYGWTPAAQWLRSLDGGLSFDEPVLFFRPQETVDCSAPSSSSANTLTIGSAAYEPANNDSLLVSLGFLCGGGHISEYQLIRATRSSKQTLARGFAYSAALFNPASRIVVAEQYIYWLVGQGLFRREHGSGPAQHLRNDAFDVFALEDLPLLASTRNGLLASSDGGANWTTLTNDSFGGGRDAADSKHAISAIRWANGRTLASSRYSIFRLDPEASEWTDTATDVQALPASPVIVTKSGAISVGTFNGGLSMGNVPYGAVFAHSPDGGKNWVETNLNSYVNAILSLAPTHDSQTVYVVGQTMCQPLYPTCPEGALSNEGLLRSDDGGASWTPMPTNLAAVFYRVAVSSLPSSNGHRTLLMSRLNVSVPHFLYRSTDSGESWQPSGDGFPWLPGNYPDTRTLVASPVLADAFYLGVIIPHSYVYYPSLVNAGFFRSHDGGVTWQHASAGLPVYSHSGSHTGVVAIAPHPDDPNALWVLTGEYTDDGTEYRNRVYRSVDGGDSWQLSSLDLPEGDYRALLVDPDDPNYVYVGGNSGTFYSSDGGIRWMPLDPGARLRARQLAASNRDLFVGTQHSGVHRMLRPAIADTLFCGNFEWADCVPTEASARERRPASRVPRQPAP